jgi:hypothetical protein
MEVARWDLHQGNIPIHTSFTHETISITVPAPLSFLIWVIVDTFRLNYVEKELVQEVKDVDAQY